MEFSNKKKLYLWYIKGVDSLRVIILLDLLFVVLGI